MSANPVTQAPLRHFAFDCSCTVFQPAESMKQFIRRDEVALHLLERGRLRVVFATGERVELGPHRLMVSWGVMPQRADWLEKNTTLHSLMLPLAWFLRWQLPAPFTRLLLAGRVLIEPDQVQGLHDLAVMRRWERQLAEPSSENRHIVLLEAEARLWRFARNYQRARPPTPAAHASKVEQPIQLIAKRFAAPLRVSALAAELKIHPDYLSTIFKRETGQPLARYLAEYRLSHACALLVTTTDKIVDIAYAAGFGSVSRFHTLFQRYRGCSPRQYRLRHRPPTAS